MRTLVVQRCPCGGLPDVDIIRLSTGGDVYRVRCAFCGAEGAQAVTPELATDTWNDAGPAPQGRPPAPGFEPWMVGEG